jgi:hypothetical protein
MSAVDVTGPVSADRSPRSGGVVVVCERTAAGEAALLHAHSLAASARARLTVVAVAGRERTDIGCGSCRQGAMFRNELACECATDALGEARNVIASTGSAVEVGFVLVRGPFRRAVPQAVHEQGAGSVVLPAVGPIRRRFSRNRVKLLERHTAAAVLVAPDRI